MAPGRYGAFEEYHEGIALRCLLSGPVSMLLAQGNYDGAKERRWSFPIFSPENFYLELQDHGLDEQRLKRGPMRIHRETGAPSW